MAVTIQKPSKGRVVHFTVETERAYDPTIDAPTVSKVITIAIYPGLVTEVYEGGVIDIKTFGPNSIYDNHKVSYNADGKSGTWRYPPHEIAQVEVEG